jgi:DGQHR domain-containing protein
MPASVLAAISYVAVRGKSAEEGAVQRILNPKRISNIRDFALKVGVFPGSVILNWTVADQIKKASGGKSVTISIASKYAQIIDGQHRVEGLRAAISEDESIGNMEIPVAIYQNLTSKECADIFLSINTEQKPVPRSLVFDLYGLASDSIIDLPAERARDICVFLNESEDSAYYKNIKFPGDKIRKGGIALSTAVTAIKPLVEDKGVFEQIGVKELEVQKQIINNFFRALKKLYGDKAWHERANAFQYASGFVGAVDFLTNRFLTFCMQHSKNFQVEFIAASIDLGRDNLITQDEVAGLGGKEARRFVFERLVSAMNVDDDGSSTIQI